MKIGAPITSAPLLQMTRRPWSEEPKDPEMLETAARWVGHGCQGLASVPRILEVHGWVEPLQLNSSMAGLRNAALGVGVLGTVGLLGAGAMDIVDGVRHKNSAEWLSGSADIARGAYLATWIGAQAGGAPALGQASSAMSLVSGGLQVAGGIARMTHKKQPGTLVNPKVVGVFEAGMGASWLAAFMGVHPTLCLGARLAFGAARAGYTHLDMLQG